MAVLDYCEMPVGRVAQEVAFDEKAFGWRFTHYGPDYAAHEEGPCQLALNGTADTQQARAILAVIRVDAIEAARAQVVAAGGTIAVDIYAYPGGRRFHFTDPAGLELACYEPAEG
ncbi:VOC family protein [Erythrobacter arachoides]|uniref:VOC family protein n=1 Tax=Aurantiacibacter arachoides TaxID=1850444 RepID=A0A845A233_9SPHN|nr:VOC family protein [Aurantiacibacter arachoides]MXO93017.1 VOC family protein [Aurantiacibacter arachoides]GGD52656.1 bleomycin resistance protein [Aurantiacibacter arachoides]